MTILFTGLAITLAAWFALRLAAGATMRGPLLGIAVDIIPFGIGFGLVLMATARPIFSGLAIAALALGLATIDIVKRGVLLEPVVFADRAELLELVRHPQLYLPFAGTARALAGVTAVLIVAGAAIWIEPPLWHAGVLAQAGLILLAPLVGAACFVVPTWAPLLRRLRHAYHRLGLTRDPARDIGRLGLLGSCVMHATLARAERPTRRMLARQVRLPDLAAEGGPIVIVQAESFMDAGRLHPGLSALLPELGRLRREAVSHGRLRVPCWGANTIRSEFAVLTGLPDRMLGLDRFNPYAGFLDPSIPSLIRQARDGGYTTICVHPFDMRFYARDVALKLLGFDHLIGQEAFTDSRREGAYVADAEVAAKVAEMIARFGPRTLVLAITMQNHGPWTGMSNLAAPLALPRDVAAAAAGLADPDALGRWVRHASGTDAMLPILTSSLHECAIATGEPGWLMLYGDHQPSLPAAFAHFGMTDQDTDYVIWTTRRPGRPQCRDLAAHELAPSLLNAINARAGAERLAALA